MYIRSSLSRKAGRTILVATAISLAIALSITLLSFGEGLREGYTATLDERGTDIFVGGQGSNPLFGGMNIIQDGLNTADSIAAMDGVRAAVPVFTGHLPFFAVNESTWLERNSTGLHRIQLFGVIPGMAEDFVGADKELLNGNGLKTPGDPRYDNGTYGGNFTGELVLSQALALHLDVGVGDYVFVNALLPTSQALESWMENSTRLEVCAIRDIGGRHASMHMSELRELSGFKGAEVTDIRVDVFDISQSQRIAQEMQDTYKVSAFTIDDIVGESDRFLSSFKGIANILSIVAVLVAAVFVATIMDISVQERKKEMGLLRAIGFSSRSIFSTVMAHSLFITMIGCALGLLLGFIATGYLEVILTSRFGLMVPAGFTFSKITPRVMAISISMGLAVAVIAGFTAFLRVMKIRVTEVLHGD